MASKLAEQHVGLESSDVMLLDPQSSQTTLHDLSKQSSFRYEQVGSIDLPDQSCLRSAGSINDDDTVIPCRFQHSPLPSTKPKAEVSNQHSSVQCPTRASIIQRRLSWASSITLVLAMYSTLFSGLFLVVAIIKPRYKKLIHSNGTLAPSAATLLSAIAAKTIELSFVTVCIVCLGQILSFRAISHYSRGISIADMCMRTWIMQPGSILVHWESLRYSGCSVLGILTIIATLVSMLYTTAAEALVAPKLVWGPVENRILVGDVYTTFANYGYLADNCMSVLPVDADSLNRNVTCLQIQYLGPSYSDYQAFTRAWRLEPEKDLPLPTTLEFRPPPTAWIQESGITAIGSWIDRVDNAAVSQKYGRFVQNVTVAMPHANILAAMDHPANGLTQGNSPSNRGSYEVEASVMSPALNVLCAGMNASELAPIVYTEWPDKGGNFDPETWEINPPADLPGRGDGEWNNRTAVDELFGFGPDYPNTTTVAPIFGTLPMPNMTAVNVTTDYVSNAIYLLGASPPGRKPEYVLCSLKAHYSPQCSTRYKVTPSGSEFSAFCEQGNRARYGALHPSMDRPIWAPDWRFVAVHWMYGMSLDSGVRNKKSTSSWLLTKLVPTMPSLPPNRPSISEALAVLAGNTLMLSAVNASFAPFANWTRTAASSRVDRPIAESFNATVRQLVYASGGTQPWQGVFYPILLFAFAISVLCLVFMVLGIRGNPITDFTEPQNLFTLAVNSPSTSKMEGACGSGPDGEQLGEKWHVSMQEQDEHYYIQFKEDHQEAKDTKGPLIWETESAIELIEDGHERLIRSSQATREYRKLALRKTWVSSLF